MCEYIQGLRQEPVNNNPLSCYQLHSILSTFVCVQHYSNACRQMKAYGRTFHKPSWCRVQNDCIGCIALRIEGLHFLP